MDTLHPAEAALQLLFKKLHPHLEDAAHALASGADADALRRLHLKLLRARLAAVESLETLGESASCELAEELEELAGNLSPMGENYRDALTLTQLCLEEAAETLPAFLPEGLPEASWVGRMQAFQAKLADPAFGAERRWKAVDDSIGDSEGED